MTTTYENLNATEVLSKVNEYLARGYSQRIDNVYNELSIFDWWKDYLSVSDLKKMKSFLTFAIEHGFDGYVCFKVGVSGCGNGMWAHTEPTTDGHSPDCDFLFRSFTPDYTEWDVYRNGVSATNYECLKNRKEVARFLKDEKKVA